MPGAFLCLQLQISNSLARVLSRRNSRDSKRLRRARIVTASFTRTQHRKMKTTLGQLQRCLITPAYNYDPIYTVEYRRAP